MLTRSKVMEAARITLKETVKIGLTWLLKAAPSPLAGLLGKCCPRLITVLPPGNNYKFDRFLDRFSVMIDPLYPIEREMTSGAYDPVTLRIIERFVRPGDVCLDIGANVGAITLALARVAGRTGKVFALEPSPVIFERLRLNMALNPVLDGVVNIYQIGISDQPGFLKWKEDLNNRGNGGLMGEEGISVPVITLDDFCRRNSVTQVRFIKVDVEGMEFEVFQGAKATLRKFRPILYFETFMSLVEIRWATIFQEIEQLLAEYHYTLYKVDADANLSETTSADLSQNTLALPNLDPRGKI